MRSFSRCLQEPESMDASFDFEERGPVKMKGRDEPMLVYYLTRNGSRPRVRSVLRQFNIKAPFSYSPATSHRESKSSPGCPLTLAWPKSLSMIKLTLNYVGKNDENSEIVLIEIQWSNNFNRFYAPTIGF